MMTSRSTFRTSSDRSRGRRVRGRRNSRRVLSVVRLGFLVVLTLASDSSGRRGFARGLAKKTGVPVEVQNPFRA